MSTKRKETMEVKNEDGPATTQESEPLQACDDSSWEKLSDVASVTSIQSESTEESKFTIYRYKNRDYKIPTTIMESFDYPGEVVDYIKDCSTNDYDEEDEGDRYCDHSYRSSLCSNKDVYQ